MNTTNDVRTVDERGSVATITVARIAPSGVSIEPCEFEVLLRRAMEILSTRLRA